MALRDQIALDLRDAMRAGDVPRLDALRMLKAAIIYAELEQEKRPLDNESVLRLVAREAKQRRESIAAFGLGGRADLVAKERSELEVLLAYLPQQMTREEIASVVSTALAELNSRSPGEFGKLMSRVMGAVRGQADGREVNIVARELFDKSLGGS